jgi:hypothetical protein
VVFQSEHAGPRRRVEQHARNEVVFREVNERIAELNGPDKAVDVSLFICECSDASCAESVQITLGEYEQVRANGACFVVVPGHQLRLLERVVDGTSRFLVVEKVGPAASVARESDPRQPRPEARL